ncbi:MAG: NAD-binding protein, partial [Halobacteriota archaeon]
NRDRFHRELSPSPTQLAAGIALVGAVSYGTLGGYALREEFTGIQTVTDAFYYTIVTASTVGYGDVVAAPESELGKLFAISVLLINVAAFAVALGVLLTPAIEAQFSKALGRMTDNQFEILDDHVLVLGYGELTEPILDELENTGPYAVVTGDESKARSLADRGIAVLTADPSDEEPLRRVGIETARAVIVATNNDAQDALAILTARQLNPDVPIIAAATQRENVAKLRRAGADRVISPAIIGGRLLVNSALGKRDAETASVQLLGEELD